MAAHDYSRDTRPRQPPLAYSVPWHVDRTRAPLYRLLNTSDEDLNGVSFIVHGFAIMPAYAPRAVPAGQSIDIAPRGRDLQRNTVMIVRWFRPSREEFLWGVSF